MKFYKVILLVCLAAGVAAAQPSSPQAPSPPGSAVGTPIAPDTQGRLLRILTPTAGQQLKVNYVDVNY